MARKFLIENYEFSVLFEYHGHHVHRGDNQLLAFGTNSNYDHTFLFDSKRLRKHRAQRQAYRSSE